MLSDHQRQRCSYILIPILALFCWLPAVSSALALLGGVMIAALLGNPHQTVTKKIVSPLLQWSIIGLGAGMNLSVIGKVGAHGVIYTIIGIVGTVMLGFVLAKWLNVPPKLATLISVGTAICGGSAIAAVAPVIEAEDKDVTVSLGTVFVLNAAALVVFPYIGHALNLSQFAFGTWSALAIHDTSSVVGASMLFGPEALAVGTTTKLVRALWIAPVALTIGAIYSRLLKKSESAAKPKIPLFILGFLLAATARTFIPAISDVADIIATTAKRSLVMTLFLIGVNLSPKTLKAVGLRPLIHGISLWFLVGGATLGAILCGLISN
ncbi:MAG: putative sulfate exporter family transporter [Deltaproteobacteria bacterium]|nr:putative sulfate exporter family transporter [Deltaproteobacteria bacterium]